MPAGRQACQPIRRCPPAPASSVHGSNERASGSCICTIYQAPYKYGILCKLRQTRLSSPMTMQKAVPVAHLAVAYEPEEDDTAEVVSLPAAPACTPQLLPVPSAWWETPAVTSRQLNPVPEEARTARQFVRELLSRWGLGYLIDDAEMIIDELVVTA